MRIEPYASPQTPKCARFFNALAANSQRRRDWGTISAIRAATWEAINQMVVGSARRQKVESGAMVRIDSTVTQALMHAPSDSSLLWDGVRVMVRLLGKAGGLPDAPPIVWRNHRRLAKKRALAIQYSTAI